MAALEAGSNIGPYALQRRLARGGMGEIWLAERQGISGFSKRVVIKTVLEYFIEDENLIQMFLDEGRLAANLTHPNIAQTFDLGQEGEVYFIAMEFVHGHDLRELLLAHFELGHFVPLNIVLRIAAQVCDGLYYAHNWKTPEGIPAGIIHRDISPQNILVAFDGNAKIVDFGIARAIHGASKTRSGVLKGKCAYMSPEQVQGEELDGRSDIFALGVVLYEMITGRRLFKRNSELATLDAVIKLQVPPPSKLDASVPKPVEALVLKALNRKREKRFADAREMQLAIEEVMQVTGLAATTAHVSAYMHKVFSEDVELNRERIRAIKAGLKQGVPGVKEEAPALDRTAPYGTAGSMGMTTATGAKTRNLVGGRRLSQGRKGLWVGLALLLVAILAAGGFLLFWPGEPEGTRPSEAADAGVAAAGADGGIDSEPAAGVARGLPDGGAQPDAGVQTATADPGPPDAGQAVAKPGKRRRRVKRRRKVKTDPKPDSEDPLDIMTER